MKRIVKGWLAEDTAYCVTEDGALLIAQLHYTLPPKEAKTISEMLENRKESEDGGEKSGYELRSICGHVGHEERGMRL